MFKKYTLHTELDDPETTLQHRRIILEKPFLKSVYLKWYHEISIHAQFDSNKPHLELGSGGGFIKDIFPQVITSDILELSHIDKCVNAEKLPFQDNSLASISMLNVFHHIPRPYLFLKEAERCLIPGGKIIMIEPANTLFSSFIYRNFHHEPFEPNGEREILPGNPLSNSNQALPFIYFVRDVQQFKNDYPALKIKSYTNHTPLLYLLSGGVSRSALVPKFTFGFFQFVEKLIAPLNSALGLFTTIVIQKDTHE